MDTNCPYCKAEVEICHDDGYGYAEDEKHQQECDSCGKTFVYTTSILFLYDTEKAPCLNGSKHKFKPTLTFPIEYTKMHCISCGEERNPTKEELEQIRTERSKAKN